jgi:hypothetical protein
MDPERTAMNEVPDMRHARAISGALSVTTTERWPEHGGQGRQFHHAPFTNAIRPPMPLMSIGGF